MPTRRDPTTEEHRPSSGGTTAPGRPTLLVAFPTLAALPLPPVGESVGRAWFHAAGLADTEISGQHLRFSRAGGRFFVEDLASRNGTWIRGARLSPHTPASIEDGAILRVGRTILVFRGAFIGPLTPEPPLGKLVGPYGLGPTREALQRLARHPERNVLIEGETGTGKELLFTEVVRAMGRAGRSFEEINVAGIPSGVFESQLFGWERGAYSGSGGGGLGVLRAHDGGSVFLDEIGELPLELQPKLLRLLESREVHPVGARRAVSVDVALVAATNRSLGDMVEKGTFRRDLHARFIARITLPSLRDRPEDLFAITSELRKRRGAPLGPGQLEVEAIEVLMLHPFPANVRDLDRVLATLDSNALITGHAIHRALGPPSVIVSAAARVTSSPLPAGAARPRPTEPSREHAAQMLDACGGNQSEAARRLGIPRHTFLRVMGIIARR